LGFAVPAFWVIPAEVMEQCLAGEKTRLEQILTRLKPQSAESYTEAARQIAELLESPRIASLLSRLVGSYLAAAFDSILDNTTRYAVRSSAIGEDSAATSYAGQMDSFLNVPATEVMGSIVKVWASAYSARALAYRQERRLDKQAVRMAVIVQAMVEAEVAGVLFSRDPQSRRRECIVSAGFGLGEGIVGDLVPTDTYRIGWDSPTINSELADKDSRIVAAATHRGGTRSAAVPPDMASRPALSDRQIIQLRDVAQLLEAALGAPQDIEWAYDRRGRLFLLQTRPIIFAKTCAASGTIRIWDNANIVESYPGRTLPLTFSFARSCYDSAFGPYLRQRALDYPLCGRRLEQRRHITANLIGLIDGRVYYNLLAWYEMMSFLPGFGQLKRSWDRMIGIAEPIDVSGNRAGSLVAALAWARCLWRLLTVRHIGRQFFARFDAAYERFSRIDFRAADADELIGFYRSLATQVGKRWSLTLDNDFAAMAYYECLHWLCRRWLKGAPDNLANDLLCSAQGMESVAPLRSLAELCAMVLAEPQLQAHVEAPDTQASWLKISQGAEFVAFYGSARRHVESYGDRGVEELKLDQPSLRDQPHRLLRQIREQLHSTTPLAAGEDRERSIRAAADDHVRVNLRNPLKRWLLAMVLAKARFAVTNRENMRFARSRLFGIVRRIFSQLGERFAEQTLICRAEDIHYLTVEEIFAIVEGASVTRNIAGLVELRRTDYVEFAKLTPAERIETQGIPGLQAHHRDAATIAAGDTATGTACSQGMASATARVVLDSAQPIVAGDHILVARSTDPGWVFLMSRAKGLVVEKGSVLSHTAIIGRELGIPTIVGVKDATRRIPDGVPLRMNGGTGRLEWQSKNSASMRN
jgi:pyruvate,water dikinase